MVFWPWHCRLVFWPWHCRVVFWPLHCRLVFWPWHCRLVFWPWDIRNIWISHEEYKQETPSRIETRNSEKSMYLPELKQKILKTKIPQTPCTTKPILKQEDKINLELIRKIMTWKKTTLPSLRNHDWKKVNEEKQKEKKLFRYIPTCNMTEINELIYADAKNSL